MWQIILLTVQIKRRLFNNLTSLLSLSRVISFMDLLGNVKKFAKPRLNEQFKDFEG